MLVDPKLPMCDTSIMRRSVVIRFKKARNKLERKQGKKEKIKVEPNPKHSSKKMKFTREETPSPRKQEDEEMNIELGRESFSLKPEMIGEDDTKRKRNEGEAKKKNLPIHKRSNSSTRE